MIVTLESCAAQGHPLYTARMDMFIKDNGIALFKKGGKNPDVCLIAAWKKQCVFIAKVPGIFSFRPGDYRIVTGNKPGSPIIVIWGNISNI